MSVQCDTKLIKRLIKYVYKKHSIQIDEKQAEIYLDSLTDFYIVISKKRLSNQNKNTPFRCVFLLFGSRDSNPD